LARFLVVRGEAVPVEDLERALEVLGEHGGFLVACVGGRLVVLRPEFLSEAQEAGGKLRAPLRVLGRVAVVFDQMFKGMGDIVARELSSVDPYEVLGRGISGPAQRGRVTLLPAEDDYDVMKWVLDLSENYDLVVFYTGDKRLARQVEAAGRPNVEIMYTPPGEYPGKEALARAVIEYLRARLGAGKRGQAPQR